MKMQETIAGVAALLGMVALAAPAGAADMKDFEQAFVAANEARKEAGKLGFEWRDTAKMLNQSKALADKGEFEAAVKLANRAQAQGEAAVAQAKTQETAWKAAVLR